MDKYDRQILELTRYPDRIMKHWGNGWGLFQFATPSGKSEPNLYPECGCLTMISSTPAYEASTEELTEAIRNDPRIPVDPELIEVEHLPIFAEWQRRLDKEIRVGFLTHGGPYSRS